MLGQKLRYKKLDFCRFELNHRRAIPDFTIARSVEITMPTLNNLAAQLPVQAVPAEQQLPPEQRDYYGYLWREIKRLAPQAQLLRGPSHLGPVQTSSRGSDLDILTGPSVASAKAFLRSQGFYRVFNPRAYVDRFQRPVADIPEPYAVDLLTADRWGAGFRLASRYESRRTAALSQLLHSVVDGKGSAYFEARRAGMISDWENARLPRLGAVGLTLLRIGNTRLLTLYLLLLGVIRLDVRLLARYFYRRMLYRAKQLKGKQGVEIALLGVDGTGKTSLSRALLRLPVPVRVVYMGSDHDHRTRLMRFAFGHAVPEFVRKICYRYEMLVRRLGGWAAAKRGWVVIYDRHPAERLVAAKGSLKNLLKHFVDRLHAWRVDVTFWLTGDYSVIYERKREQSEPELRAFDRQYRAMLQHTRSAFEIIDVTRLDFDSVLAMIRDRIFFEVRTRSLRSYVF